MADRLSIEAAMTLSALIALLEESKEGSGELDVAITLFVARERGDTSATYDCPHYTTSFDSALSLVPEGWHWGLNYNGGGWYACGLCDADPKTKEWVPEVLARTPALALVIAALKARRS